MPVDFVLPDVGEGIDGGEIIEWHVAAGDQVAEDQPLVDVQTDKAIVTIPCPVNGTVVELRGEPGDRVPVGATLAVFDRADAVAAAATPRRFAAGETRNGGGAGTRPLASPAVRKLARSSGVELSAVVGSGPGGRITREDVEAAVGRRWEGRPAVGGQIVPLRGTRRAIAHALTRSWQTIPHMTDYREVDATALAATRAALRKRAAAAGNEPLARAMTLTPLIVKMIATVLPRHPYANASIDLEREEITLHGECNIGVAVAAPQGLVVPVVHAAQRRSAGEIALEVAGLAAAARENRLTPAQLAGGTFTVNNYGALGVWLGTPIIAPGQVVNFGVGKLEDRPVVRGGQVVVRPVIPLAVSGDHRVLDGHTLAHLVNDVVELMETPALMAADLQ